MRKYGSYPLIVLSVLISLAPNVFARSYQPLYSGFSPIQSSEAYKQFKTRPVEDKSKLLYLIDRFADANVKIVYDGHYFDAPLVGRIARWFLARHYRGENPEKWIMLWCNQSIPEGNLIWVELPGGRFRLSREVLLQELQAINELTAQRASNSSALSDSIPSDSVTSQLNASLAQVVQASPNTAK